MTNPFSLSFGKEPLSFIERGRQSREIIDGFSEDNPSCQVYMITGVRGSGKTVMLTDIAKHFRKEKDWFVVDLSPERDLLQMLFRWRRKQRGIRLHFRHWGICAGKISDGVNFLRMIEKF